ncbi:DUF1045 domain-containing protein [Rhodoferax sp.]|uniref:DUF1045 domain-containing protein n=1 Tax=Rhodoferax sp. TaxID=50421 RepID=UPI00261F775F|nr:DUF1045 domain-containing protein [Rhodoferax sp.]MDD2926856.1 DUF1045 domain-containing protein [Rhodoferax sp.]
MSPRYAVYFAPGKDSPWWAFGSRWLGRDECQNIPLSQPPLPPFTPDELRDITAPPRRYGFHATLKAPFYLSDGLTADHLLARLQALAVTLKSVALGPMQVSTLGDFVALRPITPPEDLAVLAASCVTALDHLRAPLSQTDLARRQEEHLTARERTLLLQYGYPYVLDLFRFHFTLSGPLPWPVAQQVQQALADPVARLNATTPLVLDRLCLFVEPATGQPFQRLADMELAT